MGKRRGQNHVTISPSTDRIVNPMALHVFGFLVNCMYGGGGEGGGGANNLCFAYDVNKEGRQTVDAELESFLWVTICNAMTQKLFVLALSVYTFHRKPVCLPIQIFHEELQIL